MSSKPQLICITGMDGTGKSTLVDALAERISSSTISGIWDLLNETNLLFRSKKDVDNYLCRLTPDARLLFLAHAMKYSIDKAMHSEAQVVLVNAYVYKYFAAELTLGANETLVKQLVQSFPAPDVVMRLAVSPSEAAKRKEKFSRYECGLAEEPSPELFVAFQEKVASAWNAFDQTGWHSIDTSASPEKVIAHALQILHR